MSGEKVQEINAEQCGNPPGAGQTGQEDGERKRADGSTGGKGWQNFAVKTGCFERRKGATPISCEIGVTI